MRTITRHAAILLLALTGAASAHGLKETDTVGIGAMDQRSLAAPARNTLYSCNHTAMGIPKAQPWVRMADGAIVFAQKPVVEGAVAWAQGGLTVQSYAARLRISGHGLPNHTTGLYPIARNSEAYRYDGNPNSIKAWSLALSLAAEPVVAAKPACLPMGGIGVALSGGLFFNALDADARDGVATEIFDACEGHPEKNGRYHYHHGSPCWDRGKPGQHSPVVGYALDGFGIHGPQGDGGVTVTNAQLDECHGHAHAVTLADGTAKTVYHYHTNEEFPYTLGCFKGVVTPAALQQLR